MKKSDQTSMPSGKAEVKVAKFGVLGAFAAVLCCVGPLVPILLGVGGATALFGLDRYKPWFIGLGVLILALASWYAVRKQNRCCVAKSTARSIKTVATIFGIGIGSYLLLQYAIVPALSSMASSKVASAHENPHQEVGTREVTLHIDGMTCAGCAVGVESAFLDLPGVSSAKVDWKTGDATVRIDSEKTDPTELLKAEVEPQFNIRLTDEANK